MASAAPDPIVELARARADARARRDWAEADRLRADIDAAGWKVVDEGLSFSLVPSHPPDVEIAGWTRYGRPASVPSRLDAPAAGVATLVLFGGTEADEVARRIAAAREHAPEGAELVVVGDAPSPAVEAAFEAAAAATRDGNARPIDLVLTSERLGRAAAANAGIRRAGAPVVMLCGPGIEAAGDAVTPLVRALDDPGVAIAGSFGIATRDLRRLEAAGPGEVDALGLSYLAFRRADYSVRGPLDERLRTDEYLALWWSLVLRDEGAGRPPRRAVCLGPLPLGRRATGDDRMGEGPRPSRATAHGRATRRDYYRVLERFGGRTDLIGAAPARRAPAGGDDDPARTGP